MEEKTSLWIRIAVLMLLIVLAVVSFYPLAKRAEAPETHQETVQAIDDKIETVLKLAATSTVASAGISAIPGDTATPIAEKLADFSEYFLLILSVLYAEKYLLTVSGAGAMRDYPEPQKEHPWFGCRTQIKKAVLEDGVTSVGQCAFYWCIKMTEISLPESVTSI